MCIGILRTCFLCVRVKEEVLSSVIADNVTEQFTKSDISNDPTQVNYCNPFYTSVDRWVTQFNSVYTRTSLMVIVDTMVTSTYR